LPHKTGFPRPILCCADKERTEMNWKKLKSGTDIRGTAIDGEKPMALTDDVVSQIAAAFSSWLSQKCGKAVPALTISVGRDSRISGPRIRDAVTAALVKRGVTVLDCGLASTPSMFMTTVDLPCDGAIQITASHHPYDRNGLKFFTRDGGLDAPDIDVLLSFCEKGELPPEADVPGKVVPTDYMSQYAAHLRSLIQKGVNAPDYEHPLAGFKIAVDAGNGAGGFYARDVLEPLGADVSGSQFLEPDGMFPNHIPNPENEEAMASICAAVVRSQSDLGVIFDTDVDRGGAVDSRGEEINRNRLVAIASAIALEGNEGGTIVTDSITSDGLKIYLEKTLGGHHHRFKRGYKNVINEAIRLNQEGINCPLAIETSGHAALRENYFLDDGAYLVTKIIIKMACLRREGKSLDSLLAPLQEPAEAREIRLPITEETFRPCGEKVLRLLEDYAVKQGWDIAPDNREGLRVSFPAGQGDGWFLLRLSVHDPIMPLNIESNSVGGVKIIAETLYGFLKNVQGLDLSPLENFLHAEA